MEDLSKDYLFELQISPSAGLTHFLQKIDEPCLYQNNKIEAQRIFRFTWLRSFHNPVCLRLEDNRGKYTLYWKFLPFVKDLRFFCERPFVKRKKFCRIGVVN